MLKHFTIFFLTISNFACSPERNFDEGTNLKVLIVGNSILRHSPAPSLGWHGDWGMAASIPENDFLHIYSEMLKKSGKYSSVDIKSKNIAFWENDLNYNLNVYADINTKDYDVLIVRLGENVGDYVNYYVALNKMIDFFKTEKTKVIITGIVWNNDNVEDVQEDVALDNGYKYITFDDFKSNPLNYAWGLFESDPVAAHPSDKGMKAIAELLYNSTIESD